MKKLPKKLKLTLLFTGSMLLVTGVSLAVGYNLVPEEGRKAVLYLAGGLLPVTAIAAAVAGHAIIGKAVRPMTDLAEALEDIREEKDFSRRLGQEKREEQRERREKMAEIQAELEKTPIDTEEFKKLSDTLLDLEMDRDTGDEELQALTESMNHLLEDLEKSIGREHKYTLDIAQGLWTPVSVILVQSEACLEDWRLPERKRWQMEVIHRRAQNISDLLFELLFLARAEQGSQPVEKVRTNLSDLTQLVAQEQQVLWEKNDSTVQIECEIEPELYAEVDRTCYMRMMMCMLANAADYSREYGTVTVSLKRDGEWLSCSIADEGIGIAEKDLPHIWDRFYRGDTSKTGDSHYGLGLSMVKWIAEVHGGHVKADSILGVGSVFTVEFPAQAAGVLPGQDAGELSATDATEQEIFQDVEETAEQQQNSEENNENSDTADETKSEEQKETAEQSGNVDSTEEKDSQESTEIDEQGPDMVDISEGPKDENAVEVVEERNVG